MISCCQIQCIDDGMEDIVVQFVRIFTLYEYLPLYMLINFMLQALLLPGWLTVAGNHHIDAFGKQHGVVCGAAVLAAAVYVVLSMIQYMYISPVQQ